MENLKYATSRHKHIKSLFSGFYREGYHLKEDDAKFYWNDEMIEGLVEEEIITINTTNKLQFKQSNISLEKEMEWNLPQGYQFKDENGNVINATKIVIEKKKKEYPKTYEECCIVMYGSVADTYGKCIVQINNGYKGSLIQSFQRLIFYRDAYWKIYGEQMGLGKPWEPDFTNDDEERYGIYTAANKVVKDFCGVGDVNTILTFPTAEMRDLFFENFKDLIKQCKELL